MILEASAQTSKIDKGAAQKFQGVVGVLLIDFWGLMKQPSMAWTAIVEPPWMGSRRCC